MADTILIDGTDLATLAVIEDLSGVTAVGALNNEPLVIPGRQGAIFVDSEWSGYSFDIPLAVVGESRAEVNESLLMLLALLDTRGAAVTVTRVMTVGTEVTTDEAQCVITSPLQPSYLGTGAARLVVSFYNLDGTWTASGGYS